MDYIKAMFGCYAMHVPINLIVQRSSDELAVVVGQSFWPTSNGDHPLRFGSKLTHQLILGDCIIRPHVVIESDKFVGHGLTGLATMSPSDWLDDGCKILLNQMNDAQDRLWGRRKGVERKEIVPGL